MKFMFSIKLLNQKNLFMKPNFKKLKIILYIILLNKKLCLLVIKTMKIILLFKLL